MNRYQKTGQIDRYRTQDGREFDVADPFYLASCDHCGWVGSSEQCGGDDTEVYCPVCHRSGADCGDTAEKAVIISNRDA